MKISIITYCKNRMSEALNSVPRTLSYLRDTDELVFVDYDCPSKTYIRIKNMNDPRIKIVRLEHLRWFHTNHARNVGAKNADGDILMFTDVDHYVPADVIIETRTLSMRTFGIMPNEITNWGWLAVHKINFYAVNGYEEAMCGYGEDDFQMRRQLQNCGLSPWMLTAKIICVQPTVTANGRTYLRQEQIRCHEDDNKQRTNSANMAVGRALRVLSQNRNNVGRNWGWHGPLQK